MRTDSWLDRRDFLRVTTASVGAGLVASISFAKTPPRIKAIAFDAFSVFDPRPVFSLAETLFPERGLELSHEWRTRQFEYTWLRTVSGRYADFWNVTENALSFAAKKTKST